jgi:hypothetical protein
MQVDKAINFQDLDEVLHNAELRRAADLSSWLRQDLLNRKGPGADRLVATNAITPVHYPAS